MAQKLSAKDKAFNEERNKYKKQIRELERKLTEQEKDRQEKDNTINALQSELSELKEWNERLLEYMDMTEEDLINIKKSSDIIQKIGDISNIFRKTTGMYL